MRFDRVRVGLRVVVKKKRTGTVTHVPERLTKGQGYNGFQRVTVTHDDGTATVVMPRFIEPVEGES